jgi:hypothetical protein
MKPSSGSFVSKNKMGSTDNKEPEDGFIKAIFRLFRVQEQNGLYG